MSSYSLPILSQGGGETLIPLRQVLPCGSINPEISVRSTSNHLMACFGTRLTLKPSLPWPPVLLFLVPSARSSLLEPIQSQDLYPPPPLLALTFPSFTNRSDPLKHRFNPFATHSQGTANPRTRFNSERGER